VDCRVLACSPSKVSDRDRCSDGVATASAASRGSLLFRVLYATGQWEHWFPTPVVPSPFPTELTVFTGRRPPSTCADGFILS